MGNGLTSIILKFSKEAKILAAVSDFAPRWFREIKYNEPRFVKYREDIDRRSRLLIDLQLDAGLSGDDHKNEKDKKMEEIIELLRDDTLRLDRRSVGAEHLHMTLRNRMADLIGDCYFGGSRGKGGRPSNEENNTPLDKEIEIGLRNRELEESGVKTKTERIAILSDEFKCSETHVKKCIKAYEEARNEVDIEASIDRQFDEDDGEVF